jgi:hypothetical protein
VPRAQQPNNDTKEPIMKKFAATLIAGLFATAAFAQTTPAATTASAAPSAAPSAMPAAGQDKQDAGSDAKESPVAHKATATKHTTKKHASTKAKAHTPADAQGTAAGSTGSNGAVESGSAAPATK